jgi:hypothetical protein
MGSFVAEVPRDSVSPCPANSSKCPLQIVVFRIMTLFQWLGIRRFGITSSEHNMNICHHENLKFQSIP